MINYIITKKLIPGLPKNPFRNGVGQYEGVVSHATAVYGDTDEGERDYESRTWQKAFVHFFIDYDSITQVADTNYTAWGAGSKANTRFLHVELCQVKNDGSQSALTKFKGSYDRYVWLLAKLLADRKLGVIDAKTLWSHDEVSKILGGTDHTDPIQYFREWGISWTQHVSNVKAKYDIMVGNVKEEYKMNVQDANKLIALLSSFYSLVITQEDKNEMHRLANQLRLASGQPTT